MQDLVAAAARVEGVAPGGDSQIAVIFRQMREMLGLSVSGLARRLGTDISVIMDLESGAVDNLPNWPETVRIIEGYGALTGVDQGPLVSRVLMLQTPATTTPTPMGQIAQAQPAAVAARQPASLPVPLPERSRAAVATVPSRAAPVPVTQPQQAQAVPEWQPHEGDEEDAARRERRRRRIKRGALAALPLLVLLVLMSAAKMSPRSIYAAIEALPYAIRAPLRPGVDYLVLQAAPVRDGLRWVDAGNPRSRKADRLPSSAR